VNLSRLSTPRAPRLRIGIVLVALTIASPLAGQGGQPPTVDAVSATMGLRSSSGAVSQQPVLIWEHWAVSLEACSVTDGQRQCTLRIMNGGEQPRQVCVQDVQWRAADASWSIPASVRWVAGEDESVTPGGDCLSIAARRGKLLSLHANVALPDDSGAPHLILQQTAGDTVRIRFAFSFANFRRRQ
jgi:hypothetical protein